MSDTEAAQSEAESETARLRARIAELELALAALNRARAQSPATEPELVQPDGRANRFNHAELQALLDAMPAAIFISTDADCLEMRGNRLAYSLLGMPPGSNLSQSARSPQRPSFQSMVGDRPVSPQELPMQKAARTGQPVLGTVDELLLKDGTRRHLFGNAVPLLDDSGRPFGAVAALLDITELRQTEEALRRSRQDLDQAQAVAHVGSWRFARLSRRLEMSDEMKRLLGFPREASVKLEAVIGTIHPDDRDLVDRWWQSALCGEHRDFEHRVIVEGAVRWLLQRVEMQFDEDGELLGALGAAQDVTERKLAEEERARQARLKDEFLALLGHELRNPLATISTAVQLITGGVAAERRAALDEMVGRQVTVLQRLVDDLLDLARITNGQINLEKERINLSKFLQKAAVAARSSIAGRGQELVVGLPSGRIVFMADSVRLEQIVVNLLDNASKYTDRGGRIELSGTREASEVVIRCKDNGWGVSPEMQKVIFEPFARVQRPGKGAQAGLGIGLALVKQLTELHGGTITVESGGLGTGSEFVVRLPLGETRSARARTSAGKLAPASGERRSLSIMIVEDNPDVAQSLAIALEQAGHTVNLFADAPSALAGVARLDPEAIVLDIGLPGIDGYELAAKLRQKRGLQNALFVAMSGFKREVEVGRPRGEFDHYFVKPLDYKQMLAVLGEWARTTGATSKEGPSPKRKTRQDGQGSPLRSRPLEPDS